MSWTDERVEELKTMWNEGKSASQIAKTLGGVTRNAVIGKVHRLGLSNRIPGQVKEDGSPAEPVEEAVEPGSEPAKADPVEEPQPEPVQEARVPPRPDPARPDPARRPGPTVPVPPAGPAPSQVVVAVPDVNAEALATLGEVEKRARKLDLMQLTERTCKWPIGDPATDDFWFCGLPSQQGKPYCDAHVAVAFQPMSSRRDRRAGGR